jgi:two-component system chemotaxis response regulator CheB
MGKDGALGIKMIRDSGGITYGQNEESSIVYGMPKVAFKLGGIDKQVSINEVIDIINNIK